jgi:tRNA pseudouridine38-40 synthase
MLSGLSTLIESPLDFEKIRKSLDLLGSFNNYRSFCKSPEKHKSTICQIYNTELVVDSDSKGFKMYFTANRFLRGMIRILSNQLILIGKNQLSFEKFHELLEDAPTEFNLKSMYPDGLYLDKVNYEFIQSN